MLDTVQIEPAEDKAQTQELDLDLDLTPAEESPAEEAAAAELDEADLSDLEQMLDLDTAEEADTAETVDLESFDLELAEDEAPAKAEEDHEETELLGFDEAEEVLVDESDVQKEPDLEGLDLDFEDMELEEAEAAEEEPAEEDADLYMATQVTEPPTAADIEEPEPVEEVTAEVKEEVKPKKPVVTKKKKLGTPVLAALAAVLLLAVGVGTVFVLNSMNIRVPFVSDFLKPKVEDPGNLKITPLNVDGAFVANAQTGELFVITGMVKNEYPGVRRFIQVTGKLYTKGKVPVLQDTVFCGNVLTPDDLASLDLAAIKKRLSNKNGDKLSNTNVKPGNSIPFMIIFSKLPDNLDEYSVEVAQSQG